jgi:hypothetical protein
MEEGKRGGVAQKGDKGNDIYGHYYYKLWDALMRRFAATVMIYAVNLASCSPSRVL